MRRRRNSSPISAPFRCEWRPSRWLTCALLGLAVLAAISIVNCRLEPGYAWPLGVCVLGWGLLQTRAEARKPCRAILISSPPSPPCIDAEPVERIELLERGPLLILRWRLGKRRQQLLFWPDTLPRAQRRELRLAVKAHGVSRQPPGMAP